MKAVLHVDGGARGNPGPAGIGVVLKDEAGEEIAHIARGIGVTTNNVAEYQALIAGLELALEQEVTTIDVRMDSELVVSQVKGEWKIKKESLRPLAVKARSLLERFDGSSIEQVPRAENSHADLLANKGMDEAQVEVTSEAEQGSLLD
jgi:ribonuclease HI